MNAIAPRVNRFRRPVWGPDSPARTAATAGLVAIGCFAGSALTARLNLAPGGPAIVFPPYAVLTAALLLSPPRRWWVYLLAASAGCFLPHRMEAATAHVLLCEVANYLKAVVAAAGMRWLAGGGAWFDTLRGVTAFLLFAAAVGPAAAATVGAGSAVLFNAAGDYWIVWGGWFLSNAVTAVTLLPVLVPAVATRSPRPRQGGRRGRAAVAEWAVYLALLLVVGCGASGLAATGLGNYTARLYWPVPFLLWAAVRYGPAGTGGTLLAITGMSVAGALAGRGPFADGTPTENLLHLQLFLVVTSVPVLLLSSVIQERARAVAASRAAEADARRQLAELTAVYQTVPVGLAFVDTDLRYARVNDRLAEINGVPAAAHAGRPVRQIVPAVADTIEPVYRQVIETGRPVVDLEVRGTAGSRPGVERTWLVSHHRVDDGRGAVLGVNSVVQEITDRVAAEAAVRASEARYRSVVEHQTELVCRYLPDTTLTFVNEAYCRFFGRRREDLIGRAFLELIPPAARPAAQRHVASLAAALRTAVTEHEVELPDGSVGWQQWVDQPITGPDGTVLEFQGIGRDSTDRRRAEDAARRSREALEVSYREVRHLAGRLIASQEDERTRIARELHDDVSQQLSAISIALSFLRQHAPGVAALRDELGTLQGRVAGVVDVIRHLSHGLHPGVLRHAGVVAALRSHCAEFGAVYGVDLTYRAAGGLDAVPPGPALCIYRVAQEALANVARHAKARHVSVELGRDAAGGLELTVSDDGRGFDVAAGRRAGGLGLVSMEERVALARGTLTIDARPDGGARVRAWVPLEADGEPQEREHATSERTARR